jgi:hypothetical protein
LIGKEDKEKEEIKEGTKKLHFSVLLLLLLLFVGWD